MNSYHKICSCCKISKPTIEFSKNKAIKDGLSRICKLCLSSIRKKKHQEPIPEGFKICPTCLETKSNDQYYRGSTCCKECSKTKEKNRRDLKKEERLSKIIPIPNGFKVCSLCKETKEVDLFYKGRCRCKICDYTKKRETFPHGYKKCVRCEKIKTVDQFYKSGGKCIDCYGVKNSQVYVPIGSRRCPSCKEIKTQDQYYWVNGSCKKCVLLRQKDRYENDPVYLLKNKIYGRVRRALTDQGFFKKSKTNEILGCSWEEFRTHIENKFIDGMSWKNKKLWHIDHIVPMSRGKTEEEIIKLNHYTNLQPLWATDNLIKSDSYEGDNISILKLHEELGIGFRFTPVGQQHYSELESKKQKR